MYLIPQYLILKTKHAFLQNRKTYRNIFRRRLTFQNEQEKIVVLYYPHRFINLSLTLTLNI